MESTRWIHRPRRADSDKTMTPTRLALPAGFPDNVFEAIKDTFVQAVTIPSAGFENIAGGHNGVRYRLRACSDYSQEFADSLQRYGDAPPLEERYRQEKQLFGFFVSGLSALESFCFFMFFAGATRNAAAFQTGSPKQIRNICRVTTQAAYTAAFPGDAITRALISLNASPWVAEWDAWRNILIHRIAPGRVFSAAFSEPFDQRYPCHRNIKRRGILA